MQDLLGRNEILNRLLCYLRSRRGNATVLWVLSLPLFTILFLFVGSLIVVELTSSVSQTAADAGSLAATKKMDEWILAGLGGEIDKRLRDAEDLGEEGIMEAFPEDSRLRENLLEGKPLDDIPMEDIIKGLFRQ